MSSSKKKKKSLAENSLSKLPPEEERLAREEADKSIDDMLRQYRPEVSVADGDTVPSPEYDWARVMATLCPSHTPRLLETGGGGPPEEVLRKALDALASGNLMRATQLMNSVLQSDENHVVESAWRVIERLLEADDDQTRRKMADVVGVPSMSWSWSAGPNVDVQMILTSLAFIAAKKATAPAAVSVSAGSRT